MMWPCSLLKAGALLQKRLGSSSPPTHSERSTKSFPGIYSRKFNFIAERALKTNHRRYIAAIPKAHAGGVTGQFRCQEYGSTNLCCDLCRRASTLIRSSVKSLWLQHILNCDFWSFSRLLKLQWLWLLLLLLLLLLSLFLTEVMLANVGQMDPGSLFVISVAVCSRIYQNYGLHHFRSLDFLLVQNLAVAGVSAGQCSHNFTREPITYTQCQYSFF